MDKAFNLSYVCCVAVGVFGDARATGAVFLREGERGDGTAADGSADPRLDGGAVRGDTTDVDVGAMHLDAADGRRLPRLSRRHTPASDAGVVQLRRYR